MDDRRVLFFGDSFVAGVGDPDVRGWVGRLAVLSHAAGTGFLPYNLGIRHETSAQVVVRWRAEAGPRLAAGADSRVVFAFGANDTSLEDGRPRVAPSLSAETLVAALAGAAELGLPALVVGPPPMGEADQIARIAALCDDFGRVCEHLGVPFLRVLEDLIPCREWWQECAAGDDRHPAAGGYQALAEAVFARGWLDWLRAGS